MNLLVGLGNPGDQYSKTRHNIGFMVIEKMTRRVQLQKKFSSFYTIHDGIILVMPQIYMNKSGESVGQISRFYKIPTTNIFVIHDDIDLKLGKIKVKIGGGNGGHNGLKSIDQHIGSNYIRIRLGVDRPYYEDVADYVLQNFKQDELPLVEKMINFVIENISDLIKNNISQDEIGKFLGKYK